jgi:hypothetical protein
MPTRYTKAGELQQFQYEIANEIKRDAKPIADGVFGNNARHPDMATVSNAELEQIFRDAYARNDREWLMSEAQRDPQQFLDVTDRIGVPDPPTDLQGKPLAANAPTDPKAALAAIQSAQQNAAQAVAPLPTPGAAAGIGPTPAAVPMPAALPAPPLAPQAPLILGPNGQPLPAMAGGGIVTQPTVALIGEQGPEAVVPLDAPKDRWYSPTQQARVGTGRTDFVSSLRPYADLTAQATGIDPNLLLAMAANETGWGRSATAQQQNNLFSIQGPSGGASRWASYTSPGDAFQAFTELLQNNPRYAAAWQARADPARFLSLLKAAGYVADEPGYPAQAWVNQVHSIYRDLAQG